MPLHRAVEFDYPFREVVQSALPIVDEVKLVVSPYPDGTLDACRELAAADPRICVMERDWWDVERGHEALADATNVGIQACVSRYVLNLQADEVLHETQAETLLGYCRDGVLWAEFGRLNFFGDFDTYNARVDRWPCSVVRLMQRDLFPRVRSYGDATHLGWMQDYDDARHRRFDARGAVDLWHYSYTRTGRAFVERQANMAALYGLGADPRIEASRETERVDWASIVPRSEFVPIPMEHPAVMADWIARRRAAVESGAWEL